MQQDHSDATLARETLARETRRGLTYGVAAYLIWGLFPIYLKALGSVGSGEVLAQRILWSLVLTAAMIAVAGRWTAIRDVLRKPGLLGLLLATATLITVNWLVYIHAVATDRMLAASLGYYLNPLVSVVLGVVVLKEKLSRAQMGAIVLALAGITVLGANAGGALWISLTLAFSFATYGLLRKMAPVDPLSGLAIECAFLAPLAAGYLLWLGARGEASFGADRAIDLLLIASGAITAVPLLLFSAAAKRLRYATVGILQFIAPSLVFLLAVFAFGEALTPAHVICFAAIWTAVAIWVADAVRIGRATARTALA